ncbi:MAG: hypothetical protein KBS81_07665, partial [Spirochaetales bacterium]|nr:hypothetical protein [Candidatus Physcosoma equi]
ITYIQERTREALKVRKEQGVRLGRPKGIVGHSTLDKHASEIVELKRNGSTNVFIAKKFGVSSPTVGNWIKHHRDLLEEVV